MSEPAEALPKEFRDEDFAFWSAQVGSQEKPVPRWKQCAAITDQVFGDAFAQQWVKRNFSPAAKAGPERLVEALDRALAEEIHTLPWMSEETKRWTYPVSVDRAQWERSCVLRPFGRPV